MIRGITGFENQKWIFGFRYIPDLLNRAKVRTTLQYRLHSRLLLGVEWNPLANEFGPLANLTLIPETSSVPALIFSTSTDRIGTPDGQSFTFTVSKDFEEWFNLPVAPYAGITYGTFDDKLRPVGGLQFRFNERLSSLIIFDGVRVHPLLTYNYGPHAFSFLLVGGDQPGVSYSILF